MGFVMPSNLVAIPPLARTVLYYVFALAFCAAGSGLLDPQYQQTILNFAGVFGFTLAAGNVAKPAPKPFTE